MKDVQPDDSVLEGSPGGEAGLAGHRKLYHFCTFSLCIKPETLRSYDRSCQGKLGGVAGPV